MGQECPECNEVPPEWYSIYSALEQNKCWKPLRESTVSETSIALYTCENIPNAQFRYNSDTQQIIHRETGYCVESLLPTSISFIVIQPCDATNAYQRWLVDGMTIKLNTSKTTDTCLDVTNAKTTDGTANSRMQI